VRLLHRSGGVAARTVAEQIATDIDDVLVKAGLLPRRAHDCSYPLRDCNTCAALAQADLDRALALNAGKAPAPPSPYRGPVTEDTSPASSAVIRIRQRHRAVALYEPCTHDHTLDLIDGVGNTVETDRYVTCTDAYEHSVCSECCLDEDGYQTRKCLTSHAHGRGLPICPTIAAADQETRQIGGTR
jgi:hypothetical protein